MALKFANNAESVLASSINSTQTSVVVQSGQGALFPVISGADYFFVTVANTLGQKEIMRVTARVADTLTVIRGQEGTTARAYTAGDYIGNQVTAGQLAGFFNADNDGPGSGLNADLLDGFQSSTTAVANTVPVRDANGALPGNITGNAATATLATNATTATNVSGGTANVISLTNIGSSTLGDSPTDLHDHIGISEFDRVQEAAIAVGTELNLSLSGFFNKTITANTAFTISNPPAVGKAQYFTLELTNGGAFTVTWPAGFRWPSGVAPTLTVSGVDVVTAFTRDGGANYIANVLLDVR